MRRLLALIAFLAAAAFSLPAAADRLDGVLPLYADDLTAVAAVKKQPDRHVMLYFGHHVD